MPPDAGLSPPADLPVVTPDWPAPRSVRAFMSTRNGGVSAPPFDTLNLRPPELPGDAVDAAHAVRENQRRWAARLGAQPVWLDQLHGARVHALTEADRGPAVARLPQADAAVTRVPGLACTVLVADCLPVLLCDRQGQAVGAAHAGWRGLAGGVLEATIERVCALAGCPPGELLAWMGPCIGPSAFEVGPDVLVAFGASPAERDQRHFRHRPRRDGSVRWLADLPGLARDRLHAAGLPEGAVHGGHWCTVSEPSRFFSFRRDAVTGRLAASIALVPGD
jgi:hypothetical protein